MISIIIATRNRAAHLEETLHSLLYVSLATLTPHEVIIVDNGSDDATYDLAYEFPRFRFLYEARPGKSIACNYAVRQAAGDILLFSDDDVRFPFGWIDAMTAPIAAGEAEAVQGGITIAPHLDRPWLKGMLRTWLAEVGGAVPVGLVGANMAIRKWAYLDVGGLDERLGPGAAGFYDDTKLGLAIGRIKHLPSVAVEHHFDASRLSLSAFIKTSKAMARSAKIAGFHSPAMSAVGFLKFAFSSALLPFGRRESFLYWHHQFQLLREGATFEPNLEQTERAAQIISHDLFSV